MSEIRKTPVPNKVKKTPVPRKKEVPDVQKKEKRKYTRRLKAKSDHNCDICGYDEVERYKAKCGHETWLCSSCKKDCKVAMERCDKCDARLWARRLSALEKSCQ